MIFLYLDPDSAPPVFVQVIIAGLLGLTLYIKLFRSKANNSFGKKKEEE